MPDIDAPRLPPVLTPPGSKSEEKPKVAAHPELPPVDEDDYLQPKSSNPAAYMDLIGDGKGVTF